MVISPYSAAVRPNRIAPCSCASTVSGLTRMPQSAAHTTRCTRTPPSDPTDTSATWARNVSPNCHSAIPRDRPAAGTDPQPARCAARSSTPSSRGLPATSSRRYAYGSFPAACASSSTKLSTTQPFCDGPGALLRPLHRLGRVVHWSAAPPEAAAQVGHVHRDRLDREARHPRRRCLHALRGLRGRPDLAPAAPTRHVGGAVHRLHAGMGEIRRFVHRLDRSRGGLEIRVHVAHGAHHFPRAGGRSG